MEFNSKAVYISMVFILSCIILIVLGLFSLKCSDVTRVCADINQNRSFMSYNIETNDINVYKGSILLIRYNSQNNYFIEFSDENNKKIFLWLDNEYYYILK